MNEARRLTPPRSKRRDIPIEVKQKAAKEYLSDHELTLAEVAKRYDMHVNTLHREVKRLRGNSPSALPLEFHPVYDELLATNEVMKILDELDDQAKLRVLAHARQYVEDYIEYYNEA